MTTVSPFVLGYLKAALWTGTDESDDSGGIPLDKALDISLDCTSDVLGAFDPEAIATAEAVCLVFQADNARDLELAYAHENYDGEEQAGHDLWLTRCRHGAGFWDRDIGDIGDRLTTASHRLGEAWLYQGDDRKVHFA